VSLEERWVDSRGVRLHCLARAPGATPEAMPLVVVPGTFGTAEDYIDEMTALAPRACVAASLRGRGKSDTPASGYTFADHVADVASVVDALVVGRFALMGYSMGAAYALGYALQAPDRVAGLVIGDYPARYPALAATWVARAIEALPDRTRPEVAAALQRESAKVSMWDDLGTLACPVMILRGGQPETRVTEEFAAMYRERLSDVEIVTLERSGHNLWEPDFDAYLGAIRRFLERLDR